MKTIYIERSTGECRNGDWAEKLDLEGVERIVVGTGPGSFAGIRSALAFAQGYALGKKCEVLGLPSACACAAQVFGYVEMPGMENDFRGDSVMLVGADVLGGPQSRYNVNCVVGSIAGRPEVAPYHFAASANLRHDQTFTSSSTFDPQPSPSHHRLAVVGDARQGKVWIALFDGYRLERDVFQINAADLAGTVPAGYGVTTPDAKRIDGLLRETFGNRYRGGQTPTDEGLRLFAEACPSVLRPEPLPIYLNPAVR